MKAHKAHKVLARLNKRENAVWTDAWEWYMNNVRRDATRADRHAWRELCKAFPRLAKYEGAKP